MYKVKLFPLLIIQIATCSDLKNVITGYMTSNDPTEFIECNTFTITNRPGAIGTCFT